MRVTCCDPSSGAALTTRGAARRKGIISWRRHSLLDVSRSLAPEVVAGQAMRYYSRPARRLGAAVRARCGRQRRNDRALVRKVRHEPRRAREDEPIAATARASSGSSRNASARILIARPDINTQGRRHVGHSCHLRQPRLRRLRRATVNDADGIEHVRHLETRSRESLGDRGGVAAKLERDGEVDLFNGHIPSLRSRSASSPHSTQFGEGRRGIQPGA